MKSLDELIAFHKNREKECAAERDRARDFKDPADEKRVFEMWEEQRQVSRDTVSWLIVARNMKQGSD